MKMSYKLLILLVFIKTAYIGCMHKNGRHTKKSFTLLSKRNSPASNNKNVTEPLEKATNASSLNATTDKNVKTELSKNNNTSDNETVSVEMKAKSENASIAAESNKNSTVPSPNDNTNTTTANSTNSDIEHESPSNSTLEKISKFNSTKPFAVKKEDSKLLQVDNKNSTINSTLSQTENLISSASNGTSSNATVLKVVNDNSTTLQLPENTTLIANQSTPNNLSMNYTQNNKTTDESVKLIPEIRVGLNSSSVTNKTDAPIKDASIKDVHVKDASIKDVPVKDASIKDVPVKDTSIKDVPVKDASIKDNSITDIPIKDISEGQIVILKDSHSTNQLMNNSNKAHFNGLGIENQILENKQNISTLYHAHKRSHGKKHGIYKHHHGHLTHKVVTSKRSEGFSTISKGKNVNNKVKRATTSSKDDRIKMAISENIIDYEKEKKHRRFEEKKNASQDAQDDQRRNEQLHKLRKMKDHFDDFVNAIDKKEKENTLREKIKDSESKLNEEKNNENSDNDVKSSVLTKDTKDFKMLSTLNKLTDNSDNLSEKESQRQHYSSEAGKNNVPDNDLNEESNTHYEKQDADIDKTEKTSTEQAQVSKEPGSQKNLSTLALQHFAASSNVNEDDVTKRHSAVSRNSSTIIDEIKGIKTLPDEIKKTRKNVERHKHKHSVKSTLSDYTKHFHDHIYLNKTRATNEQLPNGPNIKIPKTFHPNAKLINEMKTSKVSNTTLLDNEADVEKDNSTLQFNKTTGSEGANVINKTTTKSSLPNKSPLDSKVNGTMQKNNTKEEQTETVFSFNGPKKETVNNAQQGTKEINHKKLNAMKDFLKNQHKELNYRSVITHPAKILIRPIRSTGKKIKEESGKKSIV